MQKEAYLLRVPCVTLRSETEWAETVDAGWNIIVGASTESIVTATYSFSPDGSPPAVFGDGHAAEKIISTMASESIQ
jgi:UDP-N-acetylglucosamine 2-epimerase